MTAILWSGIISWLLIILISDYAETKKKERAEEETSFKTFPSDAELDSLNLMYD